MMPQELERLRLKHDAYVDNVSGRVMTVSLETAALLSALIRAARPQSILDLGSGFSSFVVREAAPHDATILSLDDSPEWLDKTRAYLALQGVPDSRLMTFDDYTKSHHEQFALVFHDFGSMDTRERTIPWVLDRTRSGAICLFDGCHRTPYRYRLHEALRARGFTSYDLRRRTRDSYGRFAWLAVAR